MSLGSSLYYQIYGNENGSIIGNTHSTQVTHLLTSQVNVKTEEGLNCCSKMFTLFPKFYGYNIFDDGLSLLVFHNPQRGCYRPNKSRHWKYTCTVVFAFLQPIPSP